MKFQRIRGSGAPIVLLVWLILFSDAGCAKQRAATEPATAPPELGPPPRPYLLHLPGIGGKRRIDRMLVNGLAEGGIDAEVEIYDWTGDDPGLSALYAAKRNRAQAAKVAEMITRVHREDPRREIYLTGHSGGTGIAVWALEQLPDDVQIESLLLLASALSPTYDLSEALRHVRGKAYALSSAYDPVLGIGTRLFGTIDGVQTDAAGRVGFAQPPGADAAQYEKLIEVPYDRGWIRLSHIGDHIGPMMRPFAREILAPLVSQAVRQARGALRDAVPSTQSALPLP
jgi:pimeloyl-ACP methyl ester carboxylesterase